MYGITDKSVGEAEHELEAVLLGVGVPVRPVPVPCVVGLVLDLARRDAEGDSLVRLGRDLTGYVSNPDFTR